ncbi:MAG: hypothetical protein R2843_05665 [Thermomicrobiales bacterium]
MRWGSATGAVYALRSVAARTNNAAESLVLAIQRLWWMLLLVRGLVRVDPFDDAGEGILKAVALVQRRNVVDAFRSCRIVSMSVGRPTAFPTAWRRAAQSSNERSPLAAIAIVLSSRDQVPPAVRLQRRAPG